MVTAVWIAVGLCLLVSAGFFFKKKK
ncbi:LPXTG cell wall anchor domain-containing protein [Paenibacillus tarimensis]